MLLKEMKSMDSIYVSLQKELKANPNDERIINAMIEHYQTKLEVMTYIVNQLKTIRNENQNKTENEKVYIINQECSSSYRSSWFPYHYLPRR